jgi:hypothetical protein
LKIEKIVFIRRTCKHVPAITHPILMSFLDINHFVNMESKELLTTPLS